MFKIAEIKGNDKRQDGRRNEDTPGSEIAGG
jgi:hypothetical protein